MTSGTDFMPENTFDALVRRLSDPSAPLPDPEAESLLAAPESRAAHVRGLFAASRAAARALHEAGGSGPAVAALLSRVADHAVSALFRTLLRQEGIPSRGAALFALGGFGRSELSPFSDLDMLLLCDERLRPERIAEGLLYPLWDAGVEVQCVARTVAENIHASREDSRSRSNLLDARFLAGDRELARSFDRNVLEKEIYGRGIRKFFRTKLDEMAERYERYGDTVYLVEPNLKEGQGGLRDAHTAIWLAKLSTGARTVDEISEAGLVPPSEIEELGYALAFVLRVRNFLHFRAGRRDDRLVYEAQQDAARFFGHEAGAPEHIEEAADRFLRDFYVQANRIKHFSDMVIRRACRGVVSLRPGSSHRVRVMRKGIVLFQGELDLDPGSVEKDPLNLLRVFETAQHADAPLSPQALHVVRTNLGRVDDRFRRDPRAVSLFLGILRHPRRVTTTLMGMHDVRFLDRFIPELGGIFCLVTREMNHVYPVDVHSMFTIQELRKLARGEYAARLPTATRLMAGPERADILYLAALLHDVGKGRKTDHCERGAELALAAGTRMGFGNADLGLLVFLVRHHLILSLTAQGRDLNDEELLLDFARAVGTAEQLDCLYLLTLADVLAVGPGVLTGWKTALLNELYDKARTILETGLVPPPSAAERGGEAARRFAARAEGVLDPDAVRRFLDGVDHPRYLLSYPLDDLLRHASVLVRCGEGPELEFRQVEAEGYTEVVAAMRDRPGLFADIAGITAAHRLNILSADLNTRSDGWVVDVLRVTDALGQPVASERVWRAWREDLAAVLRGETFTRELLEESTRRQGAPGQRSGPAGRAPRVSVDNRASSRFTVIDIAARDRMGLLYDIASTLSRRGLNIRLAKIATTLEMAADAFYVEHTGGGKILDPQELALIRTELLTALRSGGTR